MNKKKTLKTDVNVLNCGGKGEDEIRENILERKKECIIEDN